MDPRDCLVQMIWQGDLLRSLSELEAEVGPEVMGTC
jgi:hypothetical protein